jgi:hypothetical protein
MVDVRRAADARRAPYVWDPTERRHPGVRSDRSAERCLRTSAC